MGFKLSRYARIVSQQLIQCPLQGLPICVISLGCSFFARLAPMSLWVSHKAERPNGCGSDPHSAVRIMTSSLKLCDATIGLLLKPTWKICASRDI